MVDIDAEKEVPSAPSFLDFLASCSNMFEGGTTNADRADLKSEMESELQCYRREKLDAKEEVLEFWKLYKSKYLLMYKIATVFF